MCDSMLCRYVVWKKRKLTLESASLRKLNRVAERGNHFPFPISNFRLNGEQQQQRPRLVHRFHRLRRCEDGMSPRIAPIARREGQPAADPVRAIRVIRVIRGPVRVIRVMGVST